jgi:excinuclease ABC subunit C
MVRANFSQFPNSPGVYLMKDVSGKIIYVGKATSLKERLRSYFANNLPRKTRKQMSEVADLEIIKTDSALEALFLESQLIKKNLPKYNIKEKDDKSRLYVYFTKEEFSAVMVVRETDLHFVKEKKPTVYGPFTSSKSLGDALELIRKIIPYRTCRSLPKSKCLYGHIGLCEAPCEGVISAKEYRKRVKQVRAFFEGKKSKVVSGLKKELKRASKEQEYERAAQLRDKVYALDHLEKSFILSKDDRSSIYGRIEGYDISNIFGKHAVGSMVVFTDGISEKSEYRKFKIKTVLGADDVAMLGEVLKRRFRNSWQRPDLIIIDGGRAHVNIAVKILSDKKINIPVIGIAKGEDRKQNRVITSQIVSRQDIDLFKKVRDEAHRFARGYYSKLHRKANIHG